MFSESKKVTIDIYKYIYIYYSSKVTFTFSNDPK